MIFQARNDLIFRTTLTVNSHRPQTEAKTTNDTQ